MKLDFLETEMKQKKTTSGFYNRDSNALLGFEEKLWSTSDKLRGHVDPAVYKHIVLGLIFLKYISECTKLFKIPLEAQWGTIAERAKSPEIGKIIDNALDVIEAQNSSLKGILHKDYSRSDLNKKILGELVELISTIGLNEKKDQQKDILGRVYEYYLKMFASSEGNRGGEFYTPNCVVKLLVEMLAPYKGKIFDPACGSGGMFVQSEKFVEAHGGKPGDISVYGQESNATTWRLAKMNMAIRGIKADLGISHADSFTHDLHSSLKADYIIANPPFNLKDWGQSELKEDMRWRYGVPSTSNANFAWIQHFIYHLADNGIAGFVLANGSMSSNQSGEGDIRKKIIEDDLVDCVISLPGQLFYSTQISVCIWILAKDKTEGRNRKGQTLFIDARKFGAMVDRVHAELSEDEINRIANTYTKFRGINKKESYEDVPGFAKTADIATIEKHKFSLVPGRYVGFDQTALAKWNRQELSDEVFELEKRLKNISFTSKQSIDVIKELIYG